MSAPLPFNRLPPIPHGSAEWHAARRDSLGASEAAIVLGVSPWQSRLGLYLEKTADEPPEREESEHLLWGHLLEDAIVSEVARRAGVELCWRQASLRSAEHPWATCTPDALTTDLEPVEVKNLSSGYDAEDWAEQIPEHYRVQCQHQMLVTGAKRCLFAALLWGRRLVWEWVERDEDTIRRIVIAGSEFMRRVRERDEPPADGHPKERAALLAKKRGGEAIELYESEVSDLLDRYVSAKAERLALEKRAKAAKKLEDEAGNQLIQRMGTASEAFTASGWTLRVKRMNRREYTVAACEVVSFEAKAPKE